MDYIYVNKMLKIPIYKQISNAIAKAIDEGLLTYNDRLPTEKEVCRTFSISPTVVKMAYEDLISENRIKRIKGKGTFVTNRFVFHTPLHEFYQIDSRVLSQNLSFKYQDIMFDQIEDDITAYRMLKLNKGELCYVILRVIKANQNPVILQKIYLPEKYYPKLHQNHEESDRLFDIVEKKYNHKVKHMHNTFSPMNASSDEALLLKINTDDAIYYVRSKMVDEKDHILGYIANYFPGEFTEFEVMVHAL
ncbi:MAG: GntR family transcriptional regulator [Bacillota bacterium]|nr:MAG: GntR family transcriptional regulator [Bacillota bacterium]